MQRLFDATLIFFSITPFVHVVFSIYQYVNGVDRAFSFTGNPIILATLSFVSVGACFALFRRSGNTFYILSICCSAICIVLSDTYSVFIGVITSLIFHYVYRSFFIKVRS